ncbi:hypothetical protein C8F01DRAFT_1264390 [Mycena amicta]|nr:hypothetical protein C8F01DRAFT_1264390 [Mycena amicta]
MFRGHGCEENAGHRCRDRYNSVKTADGESRLRLVELLDAQGRLAQAFVITIIDECVSSAVATLDYAEGGAGMSTVSLSLHTTFQNPASLRVWDLREQQLVATFSYYIRLLPYPHPTIRIEVDETIARRPIPSLQRSTLPLRVRRLNTRGSPHFLPTAWNHEWTGARRVECE